MKIMISHDLLIIIYEDYDLLVYRNTRQIIHICINQGMATFSFTIFFFLVTLTIHRMDTTKFLAWINEYQWTE